MPLWKTTDIQLLLGKLAYVQASVRDIPGGDHDTEVVIIKISSNPDATFWIRGFDPDKEIGTPGECEVRMVELSDGQDSRGGCSSDHRTTCETYGAMMAVLRQEGFIVVPSMDPYF